LKIWLLSAGIADNPADSSTIREIVNINQSYGREYNSVKSNIAFFILFRTYTAQELEHLFTHNANLLAYLFINPWK